MPGIPTSIVFGRNGKKPPRLLRAHPRARCFSVSSAFKQQFPRSQKSHAQADQLTEAVMGCATRCGALSPRLPVIRAKRADQDNLRTYHLAGSMVGYTCFLTVGLSSTRIGNEPPMTSGPAAFRSYPCRTTHKRSYDFLLRSGSPSKLRHKLSDTDSFKVHRWRNSGTQGTARPCRRRDARISLIDRTAPHRHPHRGGEIVPTKPSIPAGRAEHPKPHPFSGAEPPPPEATIAPSKEACWISFKAFNTS